MAFFRRESECHGQISRSARRARFWHSTGQLGLPLALGFRTWLATAGSDRTVPIWDPVTGRERATLTGHTSEVTAVPIAPDGTWLATASMDQTVRIWDPATGRISALMRVDGPLGVCAWSPGGQSLAAVGYAGLYIFTFQAMDASSPMGRCCTTTGPPIPAGPG